MNAPYGRPHAIALGACLLCAFAAMLSGPWHSSREVSSPVSQPASPNSSLAMRPSPAARADSALPLSRAAVPPRNDAPFATTSGAALPELEQGIEAGHPHPITPEHRVIQRELQLIAALNDALDLGDADTLRRLNAQYATEFPDDANALQAGYTVIADCLDPGGDHALRAARTYYDRERASTLRRYVRRSCFDRSTVANRSN